MGDEEAHLLVCVFQRITEVVKIDFDALGKPSPVARDARKSDRVRREDVHSPYLRSDTLITSAQKAHHEQLFCGQNRNSEALQSVVSV